MTLAITGATGQLGRLVINTLKTKTAPGGIVALARALDKAQIWACRRACSIMTPPKPLPPR